MQVVEVTDHVPLAGHRLVRSGGAAPLHHDDLSALTLPPEQVAADLADRWPRYPDGDAGRGEHPVDQPVITGHTPDLTGVVYRLAVRALEPGLDVRGEPQAGRRARLGEVILQDRLGGGARVERAEGGRGRRDH